MKIITSWDDGCKEDFKTAELLKKYKLHGIFFIPSRTYLSEQEIKQLAKDFEIGGHTVTHPLDLKKLTLLQQFIEMADNRVWLQELTGQEVNWFCYPRGRYNEQTIEALKKTGFKYARTTMVGNHVESENPYRIHTSVHAFPNRREYNQKSWFQYAKEQYTMAKESHNGYFHIWGHSWEVEQYSLWQELEELFEYIHAN